MKSFAAGTGALAATLVFVRKEGIRWVIESIILRHTMQEGAAQIDGSGRGNVT